MATEKKDTKPTGTGTKGTDLPGTEPRGSENAALTRTSMITDAPPLETRPIKPHPPWIPKEIDVFLLAGYPFDPLKILNGANRIWSQCYIYFKGFFHPPYDEKATRRLIGTDPSDAGKSVKELRVIVNSEQLSASQKNLRDEWHKRGKRSMAIFFLPNVSGIVGAKSSIDSDSAEHIVYLGGVSEISPERDLAHELGHLLISPGHDFDSPLMHPFQTSNEIIDLECRAARGDPEARLKIFQRMQRKY